MNAAAEQNTAEQPEQSPKHDRLYDGDTFEHRGYTFRVRYPRDEDMGEPWKEHDGHGIVSEWTRREKRPGERILIEDRGSRRYYAVAASTRIARRDGWGCGEPSHTHLTRGDEIVCAVEQDYQHLRAWCQDEWHWIGVVVTLQDYEPEERESVWGIESSEEQYLTETAYELADEILSRVEVDEPNVQLSEN